MIIEDKSNFTADLVVICKGKDITSEFLHEFIIDDTTNEVSSGYSCVNKITRFINRVGEFEGIECRDDDYAVINGKRYDCVTKKCLMETS